MSSHKLFILLVTILFSASSLAATKTNNETQMPSRKDFLKVCNQAHQKSGDLTMMMISVEHCGCIYEEISEEHTSVTEDSYAEASRSCMERLINEDSAEDKARWRR